MVKMKDLLGVHYSLRSAKGKEIICFAEERINIFLVVFTVYINDKSCPKSFHSKYRKLSRTFLPLISFPTTWNSEG